MRQYIRAWRFQNRSKHGNIFPVGRLTFASDLEGEKWQGQKICVLTKRISSIEGEKC